MNKKRRKRVLILLFSSLPTIFLGFLLFYFTIPRVGYCVDAAFDETGERLYVTAGYRGLHVFRVAPQGKITYLTTYFIGGYYRFLEVAGGWAYIANSDKGLEILDIHENVPRSVWTQAGSRGYGIHITDDKVYLASYEYGLQIFDLTNPAAPILIGNFPTTGRVWDVWVNGSYAYIADHNLGLIIIDVLHIFDIHKPVLPRLLSKYPVTDGVENISVSGAQLAITNTRSGVLLFDVQTPAIPVMEGMYPGRFWRSFTRYLR